MAKKYFLLFSFSFIISTATLFSCKNSFDGDNYVAYLGGEIENPKCNYVVFMKGEKVMDTFFLDKNNRFFHKFDSLTPGLYSFKHDPEYQYIYFDKNDSLMLRLNTLDFDNSLMFCGRGDEKNNFLMELFIQNNNDRNQMYEVYVKDVDAFQKNIDSTYKKAKSLYLKRRAFINWNEDFDKIASSSVELNHAYKKEIFPFVHEFRTGKSVKKDLPKDYYKHRKLIDLNDTALVNYSPFVKYVTVLLNNLVLTDAKDIADEMSLESNIKKLQIADTLIKDKHVKNLVVNNIANMYLLSDQCTENNAKFFQLYSKITTDKKLEAEVMKTSKNVHKLHKNALLPNIALQDITGKIVAIKDFINTKTVLFFWTKQSESQAIFSHKKVDELKAKYPNIRFISINIGNTKSEWLNELKKNKFTSNPNTIELFSSNFDEIKEKWVINKIHRTMIINANGTINNAFVSLFDANFENKLNN